MDQSAEKHPIARLFMGRPDWGGELLAPPGRGTFMAEKSSWALLSALRPFCWEFVASRALHFSAVDPIDGLMYFLGGLSISPSTNSSQGRGHGLVARVANACEPEPCPSSEWRHFSRGNLPEIEWFSSTGSPRRASPRPLRQTGVRGAKNKARSTGFASQAALPSSLEFFPR